MGALGVIGLWSLALGAVSGWLMVATIDRRDLLERARIRHPARIRQVHLDWILMGVILVAVDAAVAEIPAWIAVLVAFGTIVNPLLFVPLAFRSDASDRRAYRAVTVTSFAALSVGLPALAVHATF